MPTVLHLAAPAGFRLEPAVTTYGYYVLAPNRWDAAAGALRRPLHATDGRVVEVTVTESRRRGDGPKLRIACDAALPRADHAAIKRRVARMLHLDTPAEVYRRFWAMHPKARRAGFGRVFRSPTLFEDVIKTMTGCNVAWRNTKAMNAHLCAKVGRAGAFPRPADLAGWSPSRLKVACKVGYRAERIIRFARDVEAGRLDLAWFEQDDRPTDEVYDALRSIHGVGDYAANNILQHLDRYDRLPVDSETIRHFREVHGHDGEAAQIAHAARRHYDRFAPFQFLAYWYELWHRTSADW